MASSMKAYLAAKYMSGPKADAILARPSTSSSEPKRKKRKTTTRTLTTTATATSSSSRAAGASSSSSMIKDDDLTGWVGDQTHLSQDGDEDDEAIIASDRGFKKRQRVDEGSGWATIRGEPEPPEPADEKPQVVPDETEEEPFKGGLMSAAQVKKAFGKSRVIGEHTKEEIAAAQETVYRDASGRKLDTAIERASAAKRKREKEEKEARKLEWGKGLTQREEAEKRRKEAEELRGKAFARGVDDVEMNEAMRAEERWNDPAAAFLTKKRAKGPRKPEYTGPLPPPNRFGIKPGYRWDGVDRGNGFEKKLFQRQNEKKRHGLESYQWSVDDM